MENVMQNLSKITVIFTAFILLPVFAAAQEKPENAPAELGSVINGKAISLPKPAYPADAKAARIGGTVTVRVIIDMEGRVTAAEAIGGIENPSLRSAAEAAAMKAVFSPTTLSGQPVIVLGSISYNFIPDDAIKDEMTAMYLGMMIPLAGSFEEMSDEALKMFDEFKHDDLSDLGPRFEEDVRTLIDLMEKDVPDREIKLSALRSSILARLKFKERVCFSTGLAFGGILRELILTVGANGPDQEKLNRDRLRTALLELDKILKDSPPVFSYDFRQRLIELSALAESGELSTITPMELFDKIEPALDLMP